MTLNEILEKARESYDQAPDGNLRISYSNGNVQFYSGKKYLSKKDMSLISKLAQKKYDEKVIKYVEQQIRIVEKYKESFNPQVVENIFSMMPDDLKALVKPYAIPRDKYIKQWSERKYVRREDEGTFSTMHGELVRSKSEVIIADRLYRSGIPYRYEEQLQLVVNRSHRLFYPDFKVINIRTLSEYIIEHFGMMDKPEYASNAIAKMKIYSANEYNQGKNILYTFETTDNPLNPLEIDQLIATYLT